MTYHPLNGRNYGHVTILKFCRLPWCSGFVSDNWVTCMHMLPVAVARSSTDGSAIRYVLPLLWMTSCFT